MIDLIINIGLFGLGLFVIVYFIWPLTFYGSIILWELFKRVMSHPLTYVLMLVGTGLLLGS